jgi:hypothetical protein
MVYHGYVMLLVEHFCFDILFYIYGVPKNSLRNALCRLVKALEHFIFKIKSKSINSKNGFRNGLRRLIRVLENVFSKFAINSRGFQK